VTNSEGLLSVAQ